MSGINSGDRNSGSWNSGDWNSGSWNSGDWNSGDRNSGSWNSGNWNSGSWNSGSWNSGDWNSGNWNSGSWNSGSWNSGDWNSGDWNSGSWNSGYFNLDEPKVRIFGKETDIAREKIEFPDYMFFDSSEWIEEKDMTQKEKEDNKQYKVTGGYLKTYGYKEAWAKAWAGASNKEKEATKKLPNFDAEIFKEITGIDVEGEEIGIDDKTEEAMNQRTDFTSLCKDCTKQWDKKNRAEKIKRLKT